MGKVWVLDTETKGTGAEMVPLEKVLREVESRSPIVLTPREDSTRRDRAPEPRPPWCFKLVDAMARETLVEKVDVRRAVEMLGGVRSIVDVGIYAWDYASEDWRRLTHGEKKLLWNRRER
jgi:hypothetical protein